MRTTAFLLLLLLPLSPAAQDVRFRGKVEDVSGTQNQFVVDCTNVRLTSATVALNPLVGQELVIEGTWNGDFVNPSVEVAMVTAALSDFEIGGGGKIGELATLEVQGAPGDMALIFGGFGSGFFPLPVAGAVLVDLASVELLATGTIPGTGLLQVSSLVPNNPALIGLTYHAQALLTLGGGAGFRLTFSDCKTFSD